MYQFISISSINAEDRMRSGSWDSTKDGRRGFEQENPASRRISRDLWAGRFQQAPQTVQRVASEGPMPGPPSARGEVVAPVSSGRARRQSEVPPSIPIPKSVLGAAAPLWYRSNRSEKVAGEESCR